MTKILCISLDRTPLEIAPISSQGESTDKDQIVQCANNCQLETIQIVTITRPTRNFNNFVESNDRKESPGHLLTAPSSSDETDTNETDETDDNDLNEGNGNNAVKNSDNGTVIYSFGSCWSTSAGKKIKLFMCVANFRFGIIDESST